MTVLWVIPLALYSMPMPKNRRSDYEPDVLQIIRKYAVLKLSGLLNEVIRVETNIVRISLVCRMWNLKNNDTNELI